MSVNQTTDVPAASGYPAEAPSKPAKAAREDSRTDMVGKALGLLVLLGDEPRGASAAEISRRADLPFSTTYRLLGSLTRDGFVDYEPDGRRYHLGLRVFQLGQRVSNHHGFAGTALPILRRVTEETGEAASRVAAVPQVREALLQRQRDFARPPGLVADGRDMGTVVFPAADLKVFLTATADERAMRRHKQLKGKGIDVSLRDLSWDIAQRDARDASRPIAPLRPAPDARTIDSTDLSPEEVIARILQWLEAAGIGPKRA